MGKKDGRRATEEEEGRRGAREKGAKVVICVAVLGVVLYL